MKTLSGGVMTTLIFHSDCSAGGPALLQDAKAGAEVFKKCASCHSADGSKRVSSAPPWPASWDERPGLHQGSATAER